MVFQISQWNQTNKNRTDLTGLLTHLTRRQGAEMSATDVLVKILTERQLRGSSKGFIIGGNEVVCFQDIPLYSVAENAINHIEDYESGKTGKLRYDACGISFHKSTISQLYTLDSNQRIPDFGARPVIYERSELAKEFIHPSQYWRIVDFDLKELYFNGQVTDWTHEREWRILGSLTFHYNLITVLLRNAEQYREFMLKIDPAIVKQLGGIVVLDALLY
ncbi:hypothetical protein [Rossellomorea sp. KS-H15a]|uniref:hypothetical protein n=1 Tax=Rossellomorea sp. KS-H15a TaxID=2963940 RepID=UPI0020C6EA6C|nr:hypothetical protein [Rossellomorea sp. KS-H15a]UTE76758.1 hypothetical protein M1J35_19730 [Rossellomorea sp. KS-H15a]